jgi:hypothetical protein
MDDRWLDSWSERLHNTTTRLNPVAALGRQAEVAQADEEERRRREVEGMLETADWVGLGLGRNVSETEVPIQSVGYESERMAVQNNATMDSVHPRWTGRAGAAARRRWSAARAAGS